MFKIQTSHIQIKCWAVVITNITCLILSMTLHYPYSVIPLIGYVLTALYALYWINRVFNDPIEGRTEND